MIGETEGRKGRGREAWKTNEQEPQREFLLVGAGNEAGSLARSLVRPSVRPSGRPAVRHPARSTFMQAAAVTRLRLAQGGAGTQPGSRSLSHNTNDCNE